MAKRGKIAQIQFPLAGLDRRLGVQSQPPYTTPDACNVRPIDSLENRARGGSRPGLSRAYPTNLGGYPIQLMTDVTYVRDDGFKYWADDFSGETLSGSWSVASWIGDIPEIMPDATDDLVELFEAGLVLDAISDFDNGKQYSFGIYILPWDEEHHGEYRLYARMNNATPNALTDGVVASLALTGSSGAFSGTLKAYNGGTATSWTFSVTASPLGDSDGGLFQMSIDGGTANVVSSMKSKSR